MTSIVSHSTGVSVTIVIVIYAAWLTKGEGDSQVITAFEALMRGDTSSPRSHGSREICQEVGAEQPTGMRCVSWGAPSTQQALLLPGHRSGVSRGTQLQQS